MSRPNRKRIKLETLRAQRLEADGVKDLEVELGDEVFVFPLASWWPMKAVKRIRALKDADADVTKVLALISSQKQVDRLLELGMTLGDFQDIMQELNEGAGVSQGESTSSSE
jgi:hypothetical protein